MRESFPQHTAESEVYDSKKKGLHAFIRMAYGLAGLIALEGAADAVFADSRKVAGTEKQTKAPHEAVVDQQAAANEAWYRIVSRVQAAREIPKQMEGLPDALRPMVEGIDKLRGAAVGTTLEHTNASPVAETVKNPENPQEQISALRVESKTEETGATSNTTLYPDGSIRVAQEHGGQEVLFQGPPEGKIDTNDSYNYIQDHATKHPEQWQKKTFRISQDSPEGRYFAGAGLGEKVHGKNIPYLATDYRIDAGREMPLGVVQKKTYGRLPENERLGDYVMGVSNGSVWTAEARFPRKGFEKYNFNTYREAVEAGYAARTLEEYFGSDSLGSEDRLLSAMAMSTLEKDPYWQDKKDFSRKIGTLPTGEFTSDAIITAHDPRHIFYLLDRVNRDTTIRLERNFQPPSSLRLRQVLETILETKGKNREDIAGIFKQMAKEGAEYTTFLSLFGEEDTRTIQKDFMETAGHILSGRRASQQEWDGVMEKARRDAAERKRQDDEKWQQLNDALRGLGKGVDSIKDSLDNKK